MTQNDSIYLSSLVDLGLRPQEAKVYLACLRLGQSTVGKISELSEVQRTFVYDILKDLHGKSIVSSVMIRGKKHFSAIPIERFKEIQAEKFRKFEKLMPEIKAFEAIVGDRPRVKFFEGVDGVFSALRDTLTLPQGSEVLSFSTGTGIYEEEYERSEEFLKERAHRKISYKTICPDTAGTRRFTENNEKHLRTTRLVPAERFGFTNEINIYGNKISIISVQGELLAVIIESESVAKTQRMVFELAWMGAERASKMDYKQN